MTHTNSHTWQNLWWAYFVLLALVFVRSLFGIHSPLDVFSAIFDGFGLVGLWGYLRGTAIGWRMFWAIYFALLVVQVICGVGGIALFAVQSGTVMSYAMLAALILLVIPQCLALWRYAFRSRAIWQAARVAA
jgi:hypothetical protein